MVQKKIKKKREIRKKAFLGLLILIIVGLSVMVIISGPSLTGLTVYISANFIPTAAVDWEGHNQIFPHKGTVDISDNRYQQLNKYEYIQVTDWDTTLSENDTIFEVILYTENDEDDPEGNTEIIFKFDTGSGWQTACEADANTDGTYSCDLFADGVDTAEEINNLDVKIQSGGDEDAELKINYIYLYVNYSSSPLNNQTNEIGTISFSVQTNLFMTLTDNIISLGSLTPNENKSSEDVNDFFTLRNDGSIDFDVYAYGIGSPFTSTANNANILPNNYYFVHANSSDSGTINSTYVSVPANISTKVLLIDGLQKDDGFDTAKLGIKVAIPDNEAAGDKTADLVVYVEAD